MVVLRRKMAATSIKSLNLNAKTYQNIRKLESTVQGYIEKVSKFKGDKWGNTLIKKAEISR